jgi:LPXTG-site transpeptidase (sortase) family protein
VPSVDDSGTIQITNYACQTEYFVDQSECDIYEGGASFELSAKQGNQWYVAAQDTTNAAGLLTWSDLTAGTYQIDEIGFEWCYAEASNTDNSGYLKVYAGETTYVSVWNCGIKHVVKKPVKYPNTGVAPFAAAPASLNAPIGAPVLNPRRWAGVFDERLVSFLSIGEQPVEVRIGAVEIIAGTETLETVDGAMQDPTTADLVAWYKDSARLGVDGNIVLAGHLNYWGIPEGVFYRLADVQVGDDIVITGDKGGSYVYRVTWVEQVDASSDELDETVGATDQRSLTLITCGGELDSKAQQYSQRTVVRAELVSDQT